MQNLENKLLAILEPKKQMFGRGNFYQSFPELKIIGQRSTSKRFKVYKLDKIVNRKSKVLDIGCNCGFFSLTTAKKSKIVHSIEPNKTLINVANIVKKHMKIKNCFFFNNTFDSYKTDQKFNLIFSFAVHQWVKMFFYNYVRRLSTILEKKGAIIFESHSLTSIDRFFLLRIEVFKKLGFELQELNKIHEKKDMKRLFCILIKKENYNNIHYLHKLQAFLNCYLIIILNFIFNSNNYLISFLKRIVFATKKFFYK
tara:strand:+ start:830 stop:1594 length:765 start_codon:yes stop_codon:yes gene_type:complete